MATQATLVYTITRYGPMRVSDLNAAMAAVSLPHADLQPFGVVLNSDTTATAGPDTVQRTIVYDLNATFNGMCPDGTDQAGFFRDMYRATLAAALKTPVTAAAPVIAP